MKVDQIPEKIPPGTTELMMGWYSPIVIAVCFVFYVPGIVRKVEMLRGIMEKSHMCGIFPLPRAFT